MKLAKKLKKTMGLMLISTMVLSAVPTMAADYDNHWAKEAITEWSNYGIVAGYEDGTFKPNNEVKRSELAAFITRVFGLESTEGATKFTDVSANAWYAQDVAKVSAAGIMQGASGQFNPNGFATRQEVAVTLVNAFRLTGNGEMNFKDQAEIAAWAQEAVAALASNGYAQGQADNKFAPKANITRAEVVKLLDNIVEQLVNKAGTYTNNVAGNIVVNTKDAVLDGIKVGGNVYLAQGIGLGDATLKNTEVTGNVLVAGGGVNSIHFDKAVVTGGVVVDTKAPVRLVSKNSNLSVTVKEKQNVVLTGTFKEVVVPADVVLELKGATVEKLTVVPSGNAVASITMDKDSLVKELTAQAATQIKGNGKITLLKVQANGVTSTIKPSQTEVKPGIDAPSLPSTGGGSAGGSGTTNPPIVDEDEDDETEDKFIKVKEITVTEGDKKPLVLPSSAVKVGENAVTVNVKKLQTVMKEKGFENITAGAVQFTNLKKGDTISATLKSEIKNPISVDLTVGEDGRISYTVEELSSILAIKKESIVSRLEDLHILGEVEHALDKLGLSLEDNYLTDGNINIDTLVAKYQQALNLFAENETDADIVLVRGVLEDYGITIDTKAKSVSGTVTVETEKFGSTEYTFKIQY